ncbi:MAG: leucine-rich repeat protein [Lachnospiraceae bacterium]|nr:leucine-rich repeat protein [Lachnospiraceae bacterium]
MKNNLKRLTALILALSMTMSLFSPTAWAATETDEGTTVTTDDSMLELEGSSDVGDLIADALSETDEETSEENYICEVEVEGATAAVTYNISEASIEADVVVAIFDEDTQQMLASGTTTVSSDDDSCTVAIEGDIPTYFLVTAYLLEADTHQPLSEEYTSQLYTQEMQDFLGKTTEDFEEEQVLNLDDDDTTNFLVYSKDTVVTDEASSTATVTDNGDGTYTVTNADETFTGLQEEDTFSYTYEDGTVLIVKVASVSVSGTTVTITENKNADLSDVFDYVKIEADSDGATPTVSGTEDGVTYEGPAVSVRALRGDKSYSQKLCWSMDKKFIDEEDGSVTLKGSVAFSYTINVKLYLALSYQYASVKTDIKLDGEVSLTGKLTLVEIPLGEIDIPIMTGVYAKLKPSLQAEVSASVSFDFAVKATIGAYYDSNQSGIHSLCSNPDAEYQTKFEGKLYVGVKLEGYVTVIDEHMTKIGLDGTSGTEITMKEDVQSLSSASASKIHTCELCYAGTATIKITASAKFELLNGVVDAKATLLNFSDKLFDFYYSADHDEWNFYTTCPYISYLCTVTVTDTSGNPVIGAVITCDALGNPVAANENGVATFYLPNGSYSLEVSGSDDAGNELTGTKTLTVADNKKVLAVTLREEGGGSSEAGGRTDEEDTSESEAEAETVASGTCGDDLTWVLDSNGILTISGTGTMTGWVTGWSDLYSSSTPWHKQGYQTSIVSIIINDGVTSIGNNAFYDCTSITSVTIPDSITSIGYNAFYGCTSLVDVYIPDSVTSIGDSAFDGCTNLTTITLSNNIVYIPARTFRNCTSLTSVIIPDSVTFIGGNAFRSCTNLISVTIGNSVTSIDAAAFHDCTSLTSVIIPNSVTSIDSFMFYNCTSLASVVIGNGVTSIEKSTFYNCTSLTSVTIGNNVTSIGSSAFCGCTSLTRVIIPNSVTSIGESAFNRCSSLTSVTIGDSVTSIGGAAFGACTSLTSVDIPDSVTSLGNGVFTACENLTNVSIGNGVTSMVYTFNKCESLTSVTIGNGVTSIGASAFYDCTSLSSLTIPDSVTSIGEYAFYNCSSLTNITIPGSVTSIGNCAFFLCESLASLTTKSGVTSIGSNAFGCCTNLTSVTIPDSVTSIEDAAFDYCTSLADITVDEENTAYCSLDGVLFNKAETKLILYPEKKAGAYAIPSSVTTIGNFAFTYCTSLTNVTIPDSVTSIGSYAFFNCTSLTSIIIPDDVTFIGDSAFEDCSGLTSIIIPDGVTSIGAFSGCTSLTSVTFGSGATSIDNFAFYRCTSLTSVTIPANVTSIGNYAFCRCTNLTNVTIPNNVTSIGDSAFGTCTSLINVYYTGSESDWAAIVISSGNTNLTSANIHYNYDAASVASLDESSEAETAEFESETESEIETEPESEAETETESETESASETESQADSQVEDETESTSETALEVTATTTTGKSTSLNYQRSTNSTAISLLSYTGSTTSTDSNTQTTTFTGLVAGEAYVLLVMKDAEAEDLLAADNLLYIAQANADESGSITFTYIPREAVDGAVSYAYGTSSQNLADAEITLEADSFAYTGGAIKPLATVVYNGVTLEADVDYTMSYTDNTEVGTATATIKGRGDYAGTVTKEFTITKAEQTLTASIDTSELLVGDTAQITAAAQGMLSYESSNTTVATVDEAGLVTGLSAGTAAITVTAAATDSYNAASATLTVTVTKIVDLSDCTIKVASATYTGSALTPAVTVTDADGNTLTKGTDYTVDYDTNMVNAGSYTVTVTGKGNYTGTAEATFTIAPASLSGYTVTAASATYTGKALTPAVTVKNGSVTLASSNYTVSYSNNTNAGTGTVTVTGKGNYTGTATATFTIAKASQTVTASAGSSSIYAGKTTTVTGTGTGSITYSSSDTSIATVSSSGKVTGKKPGTVKITVKAAGNSNYNAASATVTIRVKLNKATISSLTNTSKGITVKWKKVTGASGYYIYRKTSGGKYKKIATVTGGSTVTYTDTAVKSKNGTTYIYAVRAYSGSSLGSYTGKTVVRLTGVSISSLKNAKTKKITVKWSKNSKATGYQIQYSTSSSFSSKKTVKVKGYKNVSKTISSLTKGKKYYVRVRAYRTVSGTTYYSAWSSKKSVKISK